MKGRMRGLRLTLHWALLEVIPLRQLELLNLVELQLRFAPILFAFNLIYFICLGSFRPSLEYFIVLFHTEGEV